MRQYVTSFRNYPVPEFIDPRFRENKPKTLVFSHRKLAFWACFRENCVYNFGHCTEQRREGVAAYLWLYTSHISLHSNLLSPHSALYLTKGFLLTSENLVISRYIFTAIHSSHKPPQ